MQATLAPPWRRRHRALPSPAACACAWHCGDGCGRADGKAARMVGCRRSSRRNNRAPRVEVSWRPEEKIIGESHDICKWISRRRAAIERNQRRNNGKGIRLRVARWLRAARTRLFAPHHAFCTAHTPHTTLHCVCTPHGPPGAVQISLTYRYRQAGYP